MRFIYTFIILVLLNFITHAQKNNFSFKHLTTDDGLTNSVINCIMQDSKDFMWFGAYEGLNRYDGYEIIKYRNIPGDSLSLSHNRVYAMAEDKFNNIWVGTANGMNLFDREKGTFKRYYNNPSDSNSLCDNFMRKILADDKYLWIGTSKGLCRYDLINEKFERLLPGETNTVYKDSQNKIWVGKENGLALYNRGTGFSKTYTFKLANLPVNRINSILEISDNQYLLGTDGGLVKFEVTQEHYNFYHFKNNPNDPGSISKGHVRKVFKDNIGNIWVAAQYGLCILNSDFKTFSHIVKEDNNPFSINANEVWDIYQDKFETIWLGTYQGGVNVLDINQRPFKNWKHNINDHKSLAGHSVHSFAENKKGQIWLGIDHGGLSLFDRRTGTVKTYRHNNIEKNSLSSDAVLNLLLDSENKLWIGTYGGGVSIFNPETNSFKSVKPPDVELKEWHVWDILEDYKGRIWTTSFSGLSQFDKNGKNVKIYRENDDNEKSISYYLTWSLLEDKNNTLWIGTGNGLNKYNENTDDFTYYPYITNEGIRSKTYIALSLYQDKHNRIWVGTEGHGLNLFDSVSKTFTPFTEEDGLINNTVLGILEDSKGSLWLSSNKGLTKIMVNSNDSIVELINFDKSNGIQGEQFNRNAFFKSKTGELFFGYSKGFVFFNPDSIKTSKNHPKVYFTGFQIFNKDVIIDYNGETDSPLSKDISETEKISLSYKQSVFTLKFAALNYISPDKSQYAYKLDGFDKEWNYVKNKREATYTNLDPGNYTFKVKASNMHGLWNNVETRLKIEILPPWWLTWWFKSLNTILIAGSALFFYFFRINQLKKREQVLKSKVQERTINLQEANITLEEQKEELETTLVQLKETQSQLIQSEKMASFAILKAGIAHEINNPLNFIQGGKVIIEEYFNNQPDDTINEIEPVLNMIQEGINRTAGIVDSLSLFKKNDSTNSRVCDIHKIIDNCINSLTNTINNNITIEKAYTNQPFSVKGVESELRHLLLNVLTNSVQAISAEGRIIIKTILENDQLIVQIKDTGCGIEPENIKRITDPFFTTKEPGKGIGLGMSMALSIIQQHNGGINYESEVKKGTIVKINLPINLSL